MVMSTINIENDVRHRYNRRVLFCVRIRGAALLIGLWDLFTHSIALCTLVLMFGQAPYANLTPSIDSNDIFHRHFEKYNISHPTMQINAKNYYSNLNFLTMKWAKSLNQQDKCIVLFILSSITILILTHLYGVLTNKPSYIIPYFLIKVFNVIISIVSMLGFYAYLPDITGWLRMEPNFPLKNFLLELDSQTLQLIVFTCLLFLILIKLYIAAIIWYCYGYITALNMARSIGIVTSFSEIHNGDMYSPPKYEEAIKLTNQPDEEYGPPPYTPLLSSS